MWFSFTLILCVLLCKSCLSLATQEIESNNDVDGSSRGELQPHILNGSSQKKTKFNNLDDDVLYIIFNDFQFDDLLSVAEAKPDFTCVASQIFGQKYQNYNFVVGRLDQEKFEEKVRIKYFIINDCKMALNTLRYFGNNIKKLEVDNRKLSDDQSRNISKFVNNYASASLTHIYLNKAKEDTFSQFKKPFENVVVLRCSIERGQSGEILSFNEMFPKLQRF